MNDCRTTSERTPNDTRTTPKRLLNDSRTNPERSLNNPEQPHRLGFSWKLLRRSINWSTSELNTQVNPTTCLGDTGCWIQQVTAPTLVVKCWIHLCTCILPSTCTGGLRPPVQLECKMHVHWWVQQVTTRVGAVTCWIEQPVSPKQVVGFTWVFHPEVDQFIRKLIVPSGYTTSLQRQVEPVGFQVTTPVRHQRTCSADCTTKLHINWLTCV